MESAKLDRPCCAGIGLKQTPTCDWCSENGRQIRVEAKPVRALDVQEGGAHYKDRAIQPVECISANKLNFLEGCGVKRITRWRDKPGQDRFADLEKIKHEVDLLIEMETRYAR